ncbi:MAG: eCIS core domain-containing protein, partial [Polyangia bacterium]
MSTQDRAIRDGGEGEHASEHEGGDAAVGADVAGSQTLRMRAMQRRWIQRKASRGGAGGGAGGAAAIPDGAGAQLSGDVQKRMERTIGTDLSGVRVHTGGDSAEAADAMGARAFTVGSDVHFNRGEFAPGSKEGDRLLAHELTHVAQGQKSGVQRKADAAHGNAEGGDHEAGGHEVSEPGDPAEHEADAMGDHAAEKLHGGGAKGEVKEGGGDKHGGAEPKPAGKQAAPVSRKASPNALLSSRKIHLAPKPGAKTATPDPKAADKGGGKGEKPKSAEELGKEKMIDQLISEMSKLDVADPKLAVQVSLGLQSVEKDLVKFPSNDIVKGFKAYLATKKQSIIEKCGEEIGTLVKKLEEIKAENPAEAEKLHALQGSPLIDKWNRNSICGGAVALKDRHPKIVDFQQGLAAKLKTNDDAIKKDKEAKKADEAKAHAPGGVQGGTPPGPPDKKATAAPTAVAPPATAAVASPQAPAKLDAKATGAPDAKAGGGPQKPADAKATDAKPLDAKAGGGKPGGAGGE